MYEDAKFLENDSLCLEAQVPIGDFSLLPVNVVVAGNPTP